MFAGGPLAGFGADVLLAFGLVTSPARRRSGCSPRTGSAVQALGRGGSAGHAPGGAGAGRRGRPRRRAVLPGGLHAGLQRALPARRSRRALARGRDGRGRGALPERDARSAGYQPRRRGGAARRAAVPRLHRPARPGLRRVRAADRRPAAAAGLHRQARHAVGGARRCAARRRRCRPRMAVRRRAAGLRPARPRRARAHGHPDLLVGACSASRPGSARRRGSPWWRCSAVVRRADARGGARRWRSRARRRSPSTIAVRTSTPCSAAQVRVPPTAPEAAR